MNTTCPTIQGHPAPEESISIVAGLPFHPLAQEEALRECMRMIEDPRPNYLVTANSDFAAQADRDPELKRIVFLADRILCDGQPLVWFSRLFKCPIPERVAGSDLVFPLLQQCAETGKRVYFMGTSEENLERLTRKLRERLPDLVISGSFAPPIGAIEEWDNARIVAKIREARPHLLLVALGCPKQEKWIYRFARPAGIPLSIGVGASLDFITGAQVRAPRWIRKIGFEWFWRLLNDPRRLFQRYLVDAYYLAVLNLRQWLSVEKSRPLAKGTLAENPSLAGIARVIVLSGDIDAGRIPTLPTPSTPLRQPLVVDCRRVRLLDSSGIGFLVRLSRLARQSGQTMCLLQPSPAVASVIETVKLQDQLPAVHTVEEVHAYLSATTDNNPCHLAPFAIKANPTALPADQGLSSHPI